VPSASEPPPKRPPKIGLTLPKHPPRKTRPELPGVRGPKLRASHIRETFLFSWPSIGRRPGAVSRSFQASWPLIFINAGHRSGPHDNVDRLAASVAIWQRATHGFYRYARLLKTTSADWYRHKNRVTGLAGDGGRNAEVLRGQAEAVKQAAPLGAGGAQQKAGWPAKARRRRRK